MRLGRGGCWLVPQHCPWCLLQARLQQQKWGVEERDLCFPPETPWVPVALGHVVEPVATCTVPNALRQARSPQILGGSSGGATESFPRPRGPPSLGRQVQDRCASHTRRWQPGWTAPPSLSCCPVFSRTPIVSLVSHTCWTRLLSLTSLPFTAVCAQHAVQSCRGPSRTTPYRLVSFHAAGVKSAFARSCHPPGHS